MRGGKRRKEVAVLSSQFHMGSGCWLSPMDVLCLTPPGDQGRYELSEGRPTFGLRVGGRSLLEHSSPLNLRRVYFHHERKP